MKMELKEKFTGLWSKYFNNADLPIVFYYSDEPQVEPVTPPPSAHQCMIGILNKTRNGKTVCFGKDSFGCNGGRRYLGYTKEVFPFLITSSWAKINKRIP